jgi:hypothetical protein
MIPIESSRLEGVRGMWVTLEYENESAHGSLVRAFDPIGGRPSRVVLWTEDGRHRAEYILDPDSLAYWEGVSEGKAAAVEKLRVLLSRNMDKIADPALRVEVRKAFEEL